MLLESVWVFISLAMFRSANKNSGYSSICGEYCSLVSRANEEADVLLS